MQEESSLEREFRERIQSEEGGHLTWRMDLLFTSMCMQPQPNTQRDAVLTAAAEIESSLVEAQRMDQSSRIVMQLAYFGTMDAFFMDSLVCAFSVLRQTHPEICWRVIDLIRTMHMQRDVLNID